MAGPAESALLGALVEAIRPRLPKAGLRWVAPADLHLTLRFLGATAADRRAEIEALLPAVAGTAAPVAASTARLRWWPSARAPRVLVLRVESHGALERLAAAIDEALAGIGMPPEPRRFRAHLTLARAARLPPQAPWGDAALPRVPLRIDAVSLVDSAPRADGTRYRELSRFEFDPR
jgi:2'-5' RNA ligase